MRFIPESSPVDCGTVKEVKSCNVTKKEEITTKVNKTFSSNYDTTNNDSVTISISYKYKTTMCPTNSTTYI